MDKISFETDIKPLFRYKDVNSMRGWFDLSNYDDVKANSAAIFNRIEEGSMPCDGPWEESKVNLFRAWMDGGMNP